jgi:hypothetical protein
VTTAAFIAPPSYRLAGVISTKELRKDAVRLAMQDSACLAGSPARFGLALDRSLRRTRLGLNVIELPIRSYSPMPPPSPWQHSRTASVAGDIDVEINGQ